MSGRRDWESEVHGAEASGYGELESSPRAHLDLGNLQEVAMWVAGAVTTGVVGNASYAVISNLRRQFGNDRVAELEEEVYRLVKQVRGKGHLSNRDLRLRVRELFGKSKS